MAAEIKLVTEDGVGAEVGIEPGDILLTINGQPVNDILDYEFFSQDDDLLLEIKKSSQEIWSIDIEKDYDESLGLEFDGVVFDRMQHCQNKCMFCFVDQLPAHMRSTLYIKDDDYRYSFLYGNFITLTNLKEKDWQKIENMRLSPLYVSVHCLRPEVRAELLRNPRAARIREQLQRLQKAGIEIHTQIVLCPGLNDGDILRETIEQLAEFYPCVISIGIVPVGLTGHRSDLPHLRPVNSEEAIELIKMVQTYQDQYRTETDRGLVYLADEFFLKAGQDFPEAEYYDDYCQIENGIGLARLLLDEFALLEPDLPDKVKPVESCLITGDSGSLVLRPIVDRLNRIKGLTLTVLAVPNQFFGGNVSVTGLLTGKDILAALGSGYAGKRVIIPEVVFKQGQDVFLDDLTIKDIEQKSGACVFTVDGTAADLVRKILGKV
ncbi:MAG TPA: DUF512 domain-containing protein [Syntrophomonadaceae bacterium]|nr:DUF512 domain-containing protein [Syntrophomonadaceae bacterium]